jgi:hypothetical protein
MAEYRGLAAVAQRPAMPPDAHPASAHDEPGVAGNARLTGTTGVLLLVLLAIEGLTILGIHRLLPQHLFFGFLLIPPLLLKMASTGYRFARYYSGNPRYRAAGPPQLLLRLLAPVVVISSLVLFATGIELWLFGRQQGDLWLVAHKLSFVIWFGAMTVHVLGYIVRAPTLAMADFHPRAAVPGSRSRRYLVGGALLFGVVLALATTQYATPFVLFGEH